MKKYIITLCIALLVTNQGAVFSKGAVDTEPGTLKISTDCGLEEKEKEFALLLVSYPGQKHASLTCNPLLQKFAESRAKDMATREYFSHVDPDNVGPNEKLEARGYNLPDSYRLGRSNNIESIAGGIRSPVEAFEGFLDSTPHRNHLLGLTDFYLQQNEFGIGYYVNPKSLHTYFWVVVIARKKTAEDPNLICTPPPGPCYKVIL